MALDKNKRGSGSKKVQKQSTINDPFSISEPTDFKEPVRSKPSRGSKQPNNKKKSNLGAIIIGVCIVVVIIIVAVVYELINGSSAQKQEQVAQQQALQQQEQQQEKLKEQQQQNAQQTQVKYTDGFVTAKDAIKDIKGKPVNIESLKGATSEIKTGFVTYTKHATMLSDGMLYCYLTATYEGKYDYLIQVPLSVYNQLSDQGVEPVIMEVDTLVNGQEILSDMKIDLQYKKAIIKYGDQQAAAEQQIQSKAEQAVESQQEKAQQAFMSNIG